MITTQAAIQKANQLIVGTEDTYDLGRQVTDEDIKQLLLGIDEKPGASFLISKDGTKVVVKCVQRVHRATS